MAGARRAHADAVVADGEAGLARDEAREDDLDEAGASVGERVFEGVGHELVDDQAKRHRPFVGGFDADVAAAGGEVAAEGLQVVGQLHAAKPRTRPPTLMGAFSSDMMPWSRRSTPSFQPTPATRSRSPDRGRWRSTLEWRMPMPRAAGRRRAAAGARRCRPRARGGRNRRGSRRSAGPAPIADRRRSGCRRRGRTGRRDLRTAWRPPVNTGVGGVFGPLARGSNAAGSPRRHEEVGHIPLKGRRNA